MIKIEFRNALLLLSLITLIDISTPDIFTKSNSLNAQTVNRKSKSPRKPPEQRSQGVPGNRGGGISRSNSCDTPTQELTALAPEFKQPNEDSVWGQTTSAYPKFWFYMPYTNKNTTLTFTLQNDRGTALYTSKIDAPATPGIISIQIPTNRETLQVNQKYRWKLTAEIFCDRGNEQKHTIGWVSRVSSPSADGSNWYDEVTSLGDRLLQNPSNIQLKQDWSDLLQSATLTQLASQPLIGAAKPSQK
jgi:Domain of Unknown Function (DUF928)